MAAKANPQVLMQQQQQVSGQLQRPPLDQLQLMLNQVFECTGRVLVEASKPADKERVSATAIRLKSVVSAANNSFQDSLDTLKTQLTMTRWMLTRDLITLRQKRAASTPPTISSETKDISMADANSMANHHVELPAKAPNVSISTEAQAGTNITGAGGADANNAVDTDSAIDFNALFNDPSTTPPADTANSSHQAPDADVAPFLPGLESYANADGGDASIDPSAASITTTNPHRLSSTTMTESQLPTADVQKQKEPSLDDFMNFDDFDFGSLVGGDGATEEGGTTFDDSFFDIE